MIFPREDYPKKEGWTELKIGLIAIFALGTLLLYMTIKTVESLATFDPMSPAIQKPR
jgi:hypothetical protein